MPINNNENYGINRGIDLMLRRRKERETFKNNSKGIEIEKEFNFFNKKIFFLFHLSFLSKS